MPLPHDNKIGTFTFIELVGQVRLSAEKMETFVRNGLVGVGLRKLNKKGMPFNLVSFKIQSGDGASSGFENANTDLKAYQAIIGTGAVDVERYSVNLGKFHVLDVQEAADPVACVNAIVADGSQYNDGVLHYCNWTLVAEL